MATRAVAVRTRTRTVFRRSRTGARAGGRKIPVAVVAGFLPGIIWSSPGLFNGNYQDVWQRLVAAYTGYSIPVGAFQFFYLQKGLFPVVGGAIVHWAANWLGVNKMIARARLPIEI